MAVVGEKKGRARGERHRWSKLNEAAVRDIRRQHAQYGVSGAQLARQYGMTEAAITFVLRRWTWAHVTDEEEN